MTKVIFLDIDGVLNNNSRFKYDKGTYILDPISCGLLVKFVEDHDIKVVLSSTWRLHSDHVHFLYQAGILDNCHEDNKTIDLGGYSARGFEVNEWLSRHPEVTHYAIVDDYDKFLPEQQSKFVQTNANKGLQSQHINRLIEILEINSEG